MQLIYTDESGINYSNNQGLFKDGPYIIYGGICVDEKKYFHLERIFLDLIKTYFSIDDWRAEEIHATNMWNLKGHFSKYTQKIILSFFNELLQILVKLDIQTVIGKQKKTVNANSDTQQKEEAMAIYCYLHGIEQYLSKKSETGIIIADEKQSRQESIFSKIFYDRSSWRIAPNIITTPLITSKFEYESRLCFLLDNIHYVNSKNSLFNQIVDIVLFIIMRVWTYQRLRIDKTVPADITKVPVEKDTFTYFVGSLLEICSFNGDDVYFHNIKLIVKMQPGPEDQIIIDEYFVEN
jgi:hypothetical protein